MYDLLIIGAGPAGLTAAVYAARKKISTLVVSENIGGQAALSSNIENYPGFQFITGAELVEKLEKHAKELGIGITLGERVLEIKEIDGGFDVLTNDGTHRAKALIIASGKVPRKLGIPGEDKYLGKGVTYCTTCDGPLFAGKKVCIIGGGNPALGAAIQMVKIAAWVYLVNMNPELRGDSVMRERARKTSNITIMNDSETLEIIGDAFVEGVKVRNKTTKEEKIIDVDGIFVEIGSMPSTDFLKGMVELNELGEVVIDKRNRTSKEGIFAAGDVTDVIGKQIIIAAGKGSKALIGVNEYLNRRE